MNQHTSAVNLARGLSSLMMHERCRYFSSTEACKEYTNPRSRHPFRLSLPQRERWEPSVEIDFVGAHACDMSVEVFLAHIRRWGGYADGCTLTKLRVINMPFIPGQNAKNYVFFEFWAQSRVVISGETTNFSGAGNTAREELEDVFAVLSHVYSLEIERVQLDRAIPIRELYAEEVA